MAESFASIVKRKTGNLDLSDKPMDYILRNEDKKSIKTTISTLNKKAHELYDAYEDYLDDYGDELTKAQKDRVHRLYLKEEKRFDDVIKRYEQALGKVKDSLPEGIRMANYKYDPMLCMNVPVKGTRTQDKGMDNLMQKLSDAYRSNSTMQKKIEKELDRVGVYSIGDLSESQARTICKKLNIRDAKAKNEDIITLKDLLPEDYSGNEALRILRQFGFKNVRIDGEYMIATGNRKAWEKAWQNGWFENAIMANKSKIEKMKDQRTTDYSLATEEYFGDLIKRFLNSRPDFVQAGFDYLFEEGNYSDDEKGFEKAKNDYIRELQQEADTMKREVNQIIDQGNRKHIAEVRRMKY